MRRVTCIGDGREKLRWRRGIFNERSRIVDASRREIETYLSVNGYWCSFKAAFRRG